VTGTNLLRIDTTAQTVTSVGALGVNVMEDCEFDGSGTLWGMRQGNAGGFPPVTVCRAYTINTTTGLATQQSDYGSNATLQSLAFRTANSTFYSSNQSGGTTAGHIITSTLPTASVADVGAHGLPGAFRVDALAFNPVDGAMYGIWNANP